MGTADRVTARLQDAPPLELASLKWYTVKSGETLPTIARKLNVSRADLAEANYMKVTSKVSTGQQLIVPREATVLMAARTERTIPVAESRPIGSQTPLVAQSSTSSNRVRLSYRVQEGDTLSSIAKVFKTSVASLQTWNKLRGNRIVAGDRLIIYTLRAAQAD
jgi:membrane-bound lytic murein transglycosylase D